MAEHAYDTSIQETKGGSPRVQDYTATWAKILFTKMKKKKLTKNVFYEVCLSVVGLNPQANGILFMAQ